MVPCECKDGPVQRAHSRETGKTMAIAMQWGKYFGSDRSRVLWEYLEMHLTQSGGGGGAGSTGRDFQRI